MDRTETIVPHLFQSLFTSLVGLRLLFYLIVAVLCICCIAVPVFSSLILWLSSNNVSLLNNIITSLLVIV
jgi:hypothetical protein